MSIQRYDIIKIINDNDYHCQIFILVPCPILLALCGQAIHPRLSWRAGDHLLYNSIQMTFEGWINHNVRSTELEGLRSN